MNDMDCYKCSVSGKMLVKMETYYDEKLGAAIAKCPQCGREEIIGFGKLH
jgi:hypothetical protein